MALELSLTLAFQPEMLICMVLNQPCVDLKIKNIEEVCHQLLTGKIPEGLPSEPARDVAVLSPRERPERPGLASPQGQIRLLHDLANIELQAMELGVRTLLEFPQAPRQFREQLAEIAIEEASHLKMCLEALRGEGGEWGQDPVHLGLWATVSGCDHLLERVFVVHRYLESSGLDAGEGLLRRLSGIKNKQLSRVVQKIVDDEVRHVEFGSRWYFTLCQEQNIDPFDFYQRTTQILVKTNPRREPVSFELRRRAGYEEREMVFLSEIKR